MCSESVFPCLLTPGSSLVFLMHDSFLDRMKTEVRHEIDKLVASQRLDMNLEKVSQARCTKHAISLKLKHSPTFLRAESETTYRSCVTKWVGQ